MAEHGPLRFLRVAAFTLVCVLLAASGHGMASGHHPPAALLAIGALAIAATAGRLACRERTLVEIGGAVTVVQGALHVLFALADSSRHATPSQAGYTGHAGHAAGQGHTGHQGSLVAVDSAELWGGAEDPLGTLLAHGTPSMLLAHLIAGLGAAWWLRQGEALVWRLCSLLRAPVSATLRALALVWRWLHPDGRLPGKWLPALARSASAPRRSQVLEHSLARRGPPALFAR
ncbi:hypothetical protein [Streptomyces sp. NPDC002328]|uniref:hypothetical protein n=1 Tax=Streptomyces sp. NPDC002328 TaxID=3364642 RepID=UPI00368EF0D3